MPKIDPPTDQRERWKGDEERTDNEVGEVSGLSTVSVGNRSENTLHARRHQVLWDLGQFPHFLGEDMA